MYRELCYREGWHPIQLGFPDRALVAGGGFNEGVLTHYGNCLVVGEGIQPSDPLDAARRYIIDRLAHLEKQGFQWKDDCDVSDLAKTVSVAVERYIASDPLPREWLVAVDQDLGQEYGWARPDLVLKMGQPPVSLLTPLDIKFKLTLDEDRVAQTQYEYSYSWQMLQYAWGVEGFYKEPVRNYGVIIVRARPFKIWTHFVPIDPELMEIWKSSARSLWAVMAAVDGYPEDLLTLIKDYQGMDAPEAHGIPPWLTFKWYGRYGRDPMAGAVLDFKLDEGLMTQSYIKREGK